MKNPVQTTSKLVPNRFRTGSEPFQTGSDRVRIWVIRVRRMLESGVAWRITIARVRDIRALQPKGRRCALCSPGAHSEGGIAGFSGEVRGWISDFGLWGDCAPC